MYELNGVEYSLETLQNKAQEYGMEFDAYMQRMTEKGLVEKIKGAVGVDATAVPQTASVGTESASVDTSSEPQEDINWFDQTWLGRGIAAASTTGEASDLFAEGSDVNLETVQEFIKAKEEEARRYVPSERMGKFQKQYEAEGKTWSAFFRGVKRDPTLMAELFVQSLGTQIGTAMDSEQALAAAGVGAGVGAGIGAAATAYGFGIGAIPGAIAGGMGGLATAMETTLTFGELIETELEKEGKEFTDVNIKALLEGPKGQSIRNRALGRGVTIGAFEALSGGIASKATTSTMRGVAKAVKAGKRAKLAGAAVGFGIEGVGGGLGEVAGRVVAGQEMDVAEIGFEAITGGAVAPITVFNALRTHKTAKYTLNGEEVSYAEMADFVETADDIDVAKANIKIENDFTGVGELASKKQEKSIIDSQIDDKITDKADRENLSELEKQRREAAIDAEKTGVEEVPGAQEKLKDIEDKMKAIVNKYEGAVGFGETDVAQEVAKARRDINISDTIAFAEAAGKQIGKDVKVVDDDVSAQEAFNSLREEHNKNAKEHNAKPENANDQIDLIAEDNVAGADGFIVGDSIFINKDVAGRTGAISVGSHEILHGILAKHLKSLEKDITDADGKVIGKDKSAVKELITSFKNVLSSKQLEAVTKRLQENYADQIAKDPDFMDTTDEWFTAFSDAIQKGEITFDETLFTKIRDMIHKVFKKYDVNKEFADGQAAYDFLKEYSKNVKEGKLGKRAIALAGGGITSTEFKASRSKAVEAVNAIEQRVKSTITNRGNRYTKTEFQQSRGFDDVLDSIIEDGGAINSYIKAVVKSPKEREKAIRILGERLLNYDPQAQRKTGSTEPVTIGEFLMANKDFARLVAKKELAIEGKEQAMTVSMDTQDQYGRTISETIADTTEETTVETKKQQKQRILKSLAEVTLDNKKIINLKTQLKIADLIEQNPPNLEQQLTKLVEKDVTKAVQKEMGGVSFKKGEVKVSDEYKAFIALNYENIIEGLDVTTIKNNYKTLFELTKIGVEEKRTKKADKPSLKKDSDFRKAIFKIETNKAKFSKFFIDETSDVAPQSHYNKLRSRQAGLAKLIAEGIVKNAINREIIETSTNVDAVVEAKLREFANKLDRQKLEVQGNYKDQIKFSKTQVKAAYNLKGLIESGETVFDNNGKLLPKYKNKYSKKVGDFVYNELYQEGLIQDVGDRQFIGAAFRKLVKSGTRGIAYEAWIIDQLIAIEKKYGKRVLEVTLRKPQETGGLPDVQIKIFGQLFNIEAKMSNAQYSSITFADKNGEFIIKKDYTFNDQIKPLGDQVQKGIKAAKSYLKKKYGYDWNDISTIPTKYYNDLLETPYTDKNGVEYSSYVNAMSAEMEISLDIIGEIYSLKKWAVSTIQIMGRGLFHMGTGPNPLNLPKLKGKGTLRLRISSGVKTRVANMADVESESIDSLYTDGTNTKKKGEKKNKRRVNTGDKKLAWRAIPLIPKSTLETLTSDKSIGNAARIDALMQSKEVAAMKIQRKAKETQTVSKAVRVARSVSSMSEAKGISVLDFDDTLATTKSNVLFTMPDGTEGTLNAGEFAEQGASLLEQGAKFDFSEFNQVVEGKPAPLFEKALKLAKKFGTDNMYILTARSPEAQAAIKQFLDANGLNIPTKNIIGLGRSEASAKAEWIAEKVGEGFNDFYFADDAIQNVKAVKNMLEQFDVKSKVQQARRDFVLGDPKVVKLIEESSINDVKDVSRLASPGVYNNIKFSKSHRAEYENTLSKNRPDLVRDGLISKTIDDMFAFIDGLDIPADKKRKYEKLTTKWLATSNIKLLEDKFKIIDAVDIAERFKLDIFSYNNPNEIIEAYAGKTTKKPLDPNKVNEFGPGVTTNEKYGITEHVVDNTKEGQKAVRDIIDSHWGEKSNPWCITQKKHGKLTEGSWENWQEYSDKPKSIIFQNGKLLAFKANSLHWDRMDNDTKHPVVNIKEGRVTTKIELTKKGRAIEKVTVSEDGKTTTTEYLRDTNAYSKGYKTVEERSHGRKIKVTEVSNRGVIMKVTTFDTNGNITGTRAYDSLGHLHAFNVGSSQFDYMSTAEYNNMHIASREYYNDGMYTFAATVQVNGEIRHITWEAADGSASDLKNVTHEVDGKIQIDLKKILELDPNAEGIPGFYKREATRADIATQDARRGFRLGYAPTRPQVMFSRSMNQEFNSMLEDITGIEAEKRFSLAKGRKRGKAKGDWRFFIPPSHEDFAGLLYNFMGKGRLGDKHRAFWEKALIKPLNRGMRELDLAKQSIASDFKELNKRFPGIKKKLKKLVPSGDFTFEDAIRVYLWDKNGHDIPGLSETDKQALVDDVMADPELKAYADSIQAVSKQPDYTKPSDGWEAGDLRTDLDDATGRSGRGMYLAEFTENFNEIFSEENLNKIEAAFGKGVREAIEDMAYRIKTGKNRPSGSNALVNRFVNFINGAVGSIMFFNIRSAVLQQMSIVNFLNFADNNVFAAAKAFANQKQFWSDFAYIFNSPEMKQRRGGIQTDVNGAELAASVRTSKNPVRRAIAELLRIGFTPTQIGDSLAIAIGGAPYYRNRVKTYQKQGMSKVEAEARAWEDFQEIAQATQQSARPDMVSQQQASPLGKFILAFQNVTSQFNRLGKKAFLDIKNRRITPPNSTQFQSDVSNSSRILYYLAAQNLIFYGLQTAVFAMMFDEDEDDEKLLKKKGRIINGSIDSVLRGTGVFGAILATLKNMGIKFAEQREAGYNKDESAVLLEMLNVSPPIGIKARQMVNAEKTLNYEKDAIEEMETFDIDNPVWSAVANIITSTTNIPTSQIYRNIQNARDAMDSRYQAWQRILMAMGWSKYNIGADDVEESDTKGSKKKNEHGKPVNSGRSSGRGGKRGGSR